MKCDRCGKNTNTFMVSFFNEDCLCLNCIEKEKKHPMYKTAIEVERMHVKNKNYNYKGIGLPEDLKNDCI